MALDGINVASKDLGDDPGKFIALAKEYGLPLLSTNLVYQDNGEPLFLKSIKGKFAGRSVTILGITRETRASWQDEEGRTIVTADPRGKIMMALKELDPEEAVILLAYMPRREMKELLAEVKGIDLVLACDGYSQTLKPELMGETTVLYPGSQGKYLARATLNRQGESLIKQKAFELVFLPQEYSEDEEIAGIIRESQTQQKAER